jgi:tRNA nucleotidyltransferase (CCA-adding enzyme)
LTELRKTRSELTGKDLQLMGYKPGPLFKKILATLLDSRLDGQLMNHEEEMKFVKANFK